MRSTYEILNIDLAQEYTKQRKKAKLAEVCLNEDLVREISIVIEGMEIPDDDERYHWINVLGNRAAADLLTLGKVQPENMLAMSGLPSSDFAEAVKIATSVARKLNDKTIAAEQQLTTDTIPDSLIS